MSVTVSSMQNRSILSKENKHDNNYILKSLFNIKWLLGLHYKMIECLSISRMHLFIFSCQSQFKKIARVKVANVILIAVL